MKCKATKTLYLRVSGTEVILMEVYTLDKNQKLQDRHLQEAIELLRETVTTRVDQKHKKSEKKGSKDSSGILTGSSVRVGYAFKNKPGHQTCLYPSNIIKMGICTDDVELCSLKAVSEKLVVYIQLLTVGSPKGISQLLRRLSDVKQSAGTGVSISSYFQKMSSSQGNLSQGASSSSSSGNAPKGGAQSQMSEQDDEVVLIDDVEEIEKAPPSAGRRHKIKNILERGHFPGQKRRIKMEAAVIGSNCKTVQSGHEEPVDPGQKFSDDKELDNSNGENMMKLELSSVSEDAKTDLNESHSFTVTRVDMVDSDYEKMDISTQNDVTEQDVCENNQSDTDRLSSEIKQIPAIDVKVLNSSLEEDNDNELNSSGSCDLPSASFCAVSGSNRLSYFNSDALKDILNVVEDGKMPNREQRSPVFKANLQNHADEEDTENIFPVIPCVETKTANCYGNKLNVGKALNKYRFKRKFPKFSDSDSEECIPEKKRQNISSKPDNKFTGLTGMKQTCKKMQISKDFFSGSKQTQPKLNFFTKTRKEKEKELAQVDETPELAMEINEELSDSDEELLKEITALSDVENLNEEHIQFLIRRNQHYLHGIFKGEVKCDRHDNYKKGGNSRRGLNYNSRLGPYSDDQIDTVMECLISMFCKKDKMYLDYILKVLLTEMLIKFHMEIHKTSHDESERLLAPRNSRTPEKV